MFSSIAYDRKLYSKCIVSDGAASNFNFMFVSAKWMKVFSLRNYSDLWLEERDWY